MLNNIKVVLVGTQHPGNIGMSARAMKTMGLTNLVLVNPESFPHEKATALSCNASDVVDSAVVVDTLEEAVADCNLVIGSSARNRFIERPMLTPREMGEKVYSFTQTDQKVAILFGRERNGLLNEELELCHYHVQIPCNPDYTSLNLAMAVQVMMYECRMAQIEKPVFEPFDRLATVAEVEMFHEHLEKTLLDIGFYKPDNPGKMLSRVKRIFARSQLQEREISIMRGILAAVDRYKR